MRVFVEKQQFRQWWLIVILGATVAGLLVSLYSHTNGFTINEVDSSLVFSTIIVAIVIAGFIMLELRTKIDASGITASFHPIAFFKKKYKWSEIEKVYVRKYAPLSEYGGWGVKGLGEAKAYNVSGNYGIQIVTKEKKHFLIGTQQPQDAERILKKYTEKLKH